MKSKSILRCSLAVASTFLIADEAAALPGCTTNTTVVASNCVGLTISGSGLTVTINPGVTVSGPNQAGIVNTGSGNTIINYGTISSGEETLYNPGTISSLVNFGTIGPGYHFYNASSVGTITNVGTINGQFRAIYNAGTINTLNNLQGGNNAMYITNSNLPSFYNIIINGSAASGNYGKLNAPGNGGAMTFNIYGNTGTTLVNGVAASTIAVGTYTSVLNGITTGNLANLVNGKVTGTYGGISWQLVQESTATIWDLIVGNLAAPRTATSSLAGTGFSQGMGAAHALDSMIANSSSGDMGAVSTAFGNLGSDQQVANAVKQTLPILAGGVTQSSSNVMSSVNHIVQSRVEGFRGASSGDGFIGDGRVWVKPFASTANQHDRDGVAGFKADTGGIVVGADGALNAKARVGVAIVYAHSRVDGNDPLAAPRINVDMYSLVGYGNLALNDKTDLFFQADAGHNDNRGSRSISLLGRAASSDYDSTTAHVGVGVSRAMPINASTDFSPSLRMDYTAIRDDGYTETGAGALNLSVSGQTTQELVLGTYATLSHALTERSSLSANFGVGYDTLAKRGSVTAAFAGSPGASFATPGMAAAPWIVRGGFGYAYKVSDTREISARYDVDAKDKFTNQTVSIRARQAF